MAAPSPPPIPPSAFREEAPNGMAALICGILGVTAVPFVLSIVAVIIGRQAQQHAAQNPERYKDEYARVGVILGWVGVGLGLAAIIGFVVFAGLFLVAL